MLRITNFAVPFDEDAPLKLLAAKRLKLPPQAVLEVVVVRRALDARRRHGAPVSFVYVLDVKVAAEEGKVLKKLHKDKDVAWRAEELPVPLQKGGLLLKERPVVVGFGPAGMFAGLVLAQNGYAPLVLERGQDVSRRKADVERFWRTGFLDFSSNVQFGEGGAGTFSDGKLTTRINDAKMADVLKAFVEAGAPPEIRYLQKPHIGTDILCEVVKNIRQKIISLGGEIRFGAHVTDVGVKDGKVSSIEVNGCEKLKASVALFGIGHSARDTYRMLCEKNIAMQAKPFAVGVRIEHPQALIDRAQYGDAAGDKRLPTADYALTYQDRENGRGAYSFCMCPGGFVVGAASAEGMVVTNGMSNYARDSGVANSALLVTVGPEDFGEDVLAGICFQEKYEALAFQIGGAGYAAPVQSVGDFLAGRSGSTDFLLTPTYRPGIQAADLTLCLPDFVTAALRKALPHFDGKIRGFAGSDVPMTGIETRSSAPCRILRNKDYFSVNVEGLYPIGEGAGYAGGIMSAAVDGMNAALAIIGKYKV